MASVESYPESISVSLEGRSAKRHSISSSIQRGSACSGESSSDSITKSPDIYRYAENKAWRKVSKLLSAPDIATVILEPDCSGLTFLGLCVAFSAPVEILRRIFEIHPHQILQHDMFGANVLHIACLNGSSLESVQFLVNRCPQLARAQDIDGRLPIHHAVECVCRDEISLDESLRVMKETIDVDSNTLFVMDKYECTVVDLIQEARCTEGITVEEAHRLKVVYSFLRKSCISAWKVKKLHWENKLQSVIEHFTKDTKSTSTDISSNFSLSHLSAPDSEISRFNASLSLVDE